MPTLNKAVFELSTLTGTNGIIISGIKSGDQSGHSVSDAGDVNGDGVGDIIIGAPHADDNGNDSGQSYVVFGSSSVGATSILELSDLNGNNGFKITGCCLNNMNGFSVSAAGDINKDKFDDIIVSDYKAGPNGQTEAGRTYILYGNRNVDAKGTFELSSFNEAKDGFRIDGFKSYGHSGYSVSRVGDINDDGRLDIIIGAPKANGGGQIYVVFGGVDSSINLENLSGSNDGFVLNSVQSKDYAGVSVNQAGDVDGDGIVDIIIGANRADSPNGLNSGRCYVIFGDRVLGTSGTKELSALNGGDGFVINGIQAGDESGQSVSGLGDINADGYDDLIIGAPKADPNGHSSGQSYVVFGIDKRSMISTGGTLEVSTLVGHNGFKINGIKANDFSGHSVNAAGDFNADGIEDILIGAYGANRCAGQSYVIFGDVGIGATGTFELSALNGINGFKINGVTSSKNNNCWSYNGDQSGTSVSQARDINADGVDDIIIGAPQAGSGGHSYVLFGSPKPTITRNQLSVTKPGSVITLTPKNLNANFPDKFQDKFSAKNITYFPVDVIRGQFEHVDEPGVSIDFFTQAQINQRQVTFSHEGVNAKPAYKIYARPYLNSPIVTTTQPATITYNTEPVLVNNYLRIEEGQTVTLTNELTAIDETDDPATLKFKIQEIQHGFFQYITFQRHQITEFLQANVTHQQVQFVADGTKNAPSYLVSITDGEITTRPRLVNTFFTPINDAPILGKNELIVNRWKPTTLTKNDLSASDEETNPNALIFYVSGIENGHFAYNYDSQNSITSFTQSDIITKKVQFEFAGGVKLPSYNVSVSDGVMLTPPVPANVRFNEDEVLPSSLTFSTTNHVNTKIILGVSLSVMALCLIGGGILYLRKKRTAGNGYSRHNDDGEGVGAGNEDGTPMNTINSLEQFEYMEKRVKSLEKSILAMQTQGSEELEQSSTVYLQ